MTEDACYRPGGVPSIPPCEDRSSPTGRANAEGKLARSIHLFVPVCRLTVATCAGEGEEERTSRFGEKKTLRRQKCVRGLHLWRKFTDSTSLVAYSLFMSSKSSMIFVYVVNKTYRKYD